MELLVLLLLLGAGWIALSAWARGTADQCIESPEGKAVVKQAVERVVAARTLNVSLPPDEAGGIWSAVKRAASEAKGQTLWTVLQDTIAKLGQLPDDVRSKAILAFIDKRAKLQSRLPNMRVAGRLRMGAFLQREARKRFDMDMAEGYALWLAGAWLESSEQNSVHANMAHGLLETIARECTSAIADDPASSEQV